MTVALRSMVLSTSPGTLIGRENELRLRIGCHQALLRQAARRLEAQGLLYSRRGASGGYFASRPDETLVIDTAALYLVGSGLTLRDTLIATRSMVRDAVAIAARRITTDTRGEILDLHDELAAAIPEDTDATTFLREEERIDHAVFSMVNIPALHLFINMLNRFALDDFGSAMFVRQPERRRLFRAARIATLDAILKGDPDAAQHASDQALEMIDQWLSDEVLDRRISASRMLPGDDEPYA